METVTTKVPCNQTTNTYCEGMVTEDSKKKKTTNEYLEKPMNESQVYDDIIKSLQESKEQGKPIEEGLFTGLFAGAAAFTVRPTIMKAVANILGIDLKGPLGSLMTSRLILPTV